MYTAIAQTRNINIEGFSLLLDTTSTEKRSYQYNKFLLDRYQYFYNLYQSAQLYLAYITRIFLTSSPIHNNPGPSCQNTSGQSDHLTGEEISVIGVGYAVRPIAQGLGVQSGPIKRRS